jgi:hypothetical protein
MMIGQLLPRILRRLRCGTFLLLFAAAVLTSRSCDAQAPVNHSIVATKDMIPEPVIPAILKAFKTFEVVGMPAAHGQKDIDDVILSLIRDPGFPALVNDIVVECGNVRYQPILDRYIAGENVPFTEVQHVWRDTTVQQMCGSSGFYEQLYPLVRSLNQGLPAANRIRIVAADPPIDWSKIHSYQDLTPFFDRDGSIASVMEREVLSKHRKALMLFGVFHLLHGGGPGQGDAVTRYERRYPGRTFVISDLGYFGAGSEVPADVSALDAVWPSLIRTKNSRLGLLSLDSFMSSPLTTDRDCNVVDAFAETPANRIADQIDAFLYLGPQGSLLAEPLPADIALDRTYRAEWLRRMKLVGLPGPSTLEEIDAEIMAGAAHPLLNQSRGQPVSQEAKSRIRQACLSTKNAAVNAGK